MPWTEKDVESHKKGLTDKQKKQWVRIANSVLAACLKKGGTDETCAPKAIKQANGVVGQNQNASAYSAYVNKQMDAYEAEIRLHQDKPYLVVPVVMMVEGVHHGSAGPLLHLMEDLGKFPGAWNGIPIVINHPEQDGVGVSANSPDIIESQRVGRVYNTNVEGTKLRAEAWLDEDKLNEVCPDVLTSINEGKMLEVSVGVYSEEEEVEGTWNGETYSAIARNHRPDHLAILLGATGACSCADGCGLRNNSGITERLLGHKDIEDKQDVEVGSGITDEDTAISTNNNKEVKMANECAPCIKAKVDALIANSQGRWVEDDREFLQTLTEGQLDKMGPIEVEKVVEKVVEKEVQVNALSAEDQAALATYKNLLKEQKNQMIIAIQTNSSKELWPDAVLNAMDSDMLKRVFDSVKRDDVVDYSIAGVSRTIAGNEVEPLLPIGVIVETKK